MHSRDDTSEYAELRNDMATVLAYGMSLSIALTPLRIHGQRGTNAKLIFAKMLAHTKSLQGLAPTGLKSDRKGIAEFWDVSSSCCLSRSVIEAFDTLAYVALEDVDETEREFRVLLWELHAEDRKLQSIHLLSKEHPELAHTEARVSDLKHQLATNLFLKSLDPKRQKDLTGKKIEPFHHRAPERNRRAGVNHEFYMAAYILLSAHTHTHPMAIKQLRSFRAGTVESLRFMSLPSRYALAFLAKAILGMRSLFEAHAPELPEPTAGAIEGWASIASGKV